MLSSIRHVLTPSPNHVKNQDLSDLTLDTSPAASNSLAPDSSLPPFSPLVASQEDTSPRIGQASNGNDRIAPAQQDMDSSLAQRSGWNASLLRYSSAEPQQRRGDTVFAPMAAGDDTPKSPKTISLDGASDNQEEPTTEGAQPRRSPPPSTEPAQYTSKSQSINQYFIHNEDRTEMELETSNASQPSELMTKASREKVPWPSEAEGVTTTSEPAKGQSEQNAPATADDAKPSTSKSRQPKRKREEATPETETKAVKKQRGRGKKGGASIAIAKPCDNSEDMSAKGEDSEEVEASISNVQQKDGAKDTSSKEAGTPNGEKVSSASVKQQATVKVEVPKKRGRPKKEDGTTQNAKSQRTPKGATPTKRGRAKKEAAPQAIRKAKLIKEDEKSSSTPKKRGRPAKQAQSTPVTEPASVPTADTPKKRGRPKKVQETSKGTEPQVAPIADTPKKRGRTMKNKDTAEPTEPQGSSNVRITTEKRGRPKAAGQSKDSKALAPGKRGRPRKEPGAYKGAKPTGINKKKAGKK